MCHFWNWFFKSFQQPFRRVSEDNFFIKFRNNWFLSAYLLLLIRIEDQFMQNLNRLWWIFPLEEDLYRNIKFTPTVFAYFKWRRFYYSYSVRKSWVESEDYFINVLWKVIIRVEGANIADSTVLNLFLDFLSLEEVDSTVDNWFEAFEFFLHLYFFNF